MQTNLRFQLTPVILSKIKKTQVTVDAVEDVEKEEHFTTGRIVEFSCTRLFVSVSIYECIHALMRK